MSPVKIIAALLVALVAGFFLVLRPIVERSPVEQAERVQGLIVDARDVIWRICGSAESTTGAFAVQTCKGQGTVEEHGENRLRKAMQPAASGGQSLRVQIDRRPTIIKVAAEVPPASGGLFRRGVAGGPVNFMLEENVFDGSISGRCWPAHPELCRDGTWEPDIEA